MVPGMSPPGSILLGGTNNPSKTMTYSGNGAGIFAVNVRIEGVCAQNAWGSGATSAFAPSVEAIASVNVVTCSPDAEQSMGGTSVLVQLKSGTNQVHGQRLNILSIRAGYTCMARARARRSPPHS
jgi:hypothetical protein